MTGAKPDPDATPTATPWQEYLAAAQSLDAVVRKATADAAATSQATGVARAELAVLRQRVDQQRAILIGEAVRRGLWAPELAPTAAELAEAHARVAAAGPGYADALRDCRLLLDQVEAALYAAGPPAPPVSGAPPGLAPPGSVPPGSVPPVTTAPPAISVPPAPMPPAPATPGFPTPLAGPGFARPGFTGPGAAGPGSAGPGFAGPRAAGPGFAGSPDQAAASSGSPVQSPSAAHRILPTSMTPGPVSLGGSPVHPATPVGSLNTGPRWWPPPMWALIGVPLGIAAVFVCGLSLLLILVR